MSLSCYPVMPDCTRSNDFSEIVRYSLFIYWIHSIEPGLCAPYVSSGYWMPSTYVLSVAALCVTMATSKCFHLSSNFNLELALHLNSNAYFQTEIRCGMHRNVKQKQEESKQAHNLIIKNLLYATPRELNSLYAIL